MNTSTPSRPAARQIKGSWEDLLTQARRHARNYNDEAIPLFRRVFDGLAALPPSARNAGDKRLYELMTGAGIELHGYLNVVERYDESLAVLEKLRSLLPDDEKNDLNAIKSNVLLISDRNDEAVAMLREQIVGEAATPYHFGHLISVLNRLKRYDEALVVTDQMAAWIEAEAETGNMDDEELLSTRQYQRRLRAATLLEAGQMDEALTIFDALYKEGGSSAFSPQLIYTQLIKMGEYEAALRIIDRDQSRPARAAFWRGLVYRYQGDTAKAQKIWQTMTREQFVAKDQNSMIEHVLSHYYLGDPDGEGREVVLRAMENRSQNTSWILFYLAGLGWAVRGDFVTAQSNFKLAQSQLKAAAESKTIPNQYWRFLHDLVPDAAEQFAAMFDTGSAP
jgi:tetratricopeptide (TPR) repeat protein